MVLRALAAVGWSSKRAVPTDQYSVLLVDVLRGMVSEKSAAFEAAFARALNDPDTTSVERPDDRLSEVQAEFNAFRERVAALEAVKPAPKELLQFHIRAVALARAIVETQGRALAEVISTIVGNHRGTAKMRRELDRWDGRLEQAHQDFAKELREVRDKHPEIYTALHLPVDVLEKIDIR
jgi:hypothetical protein